MDELVLLARLEGDDEDPTQAAKPTMMGKDMRQLIMSGQGPQALQLWKVGCLSDSCQFLRQHLAHWYFGQLPDCSCSVNGALAFTAVLPHMCRHVQAVHVLGLHVAIGHAACDD